METGAGCISGVGVLQARLWNLEAAGSNPEATGSNPEATGSNPRFASFLPLLFFFLYGTVDWYLYMLMKWIVPCTLQIHIMLIPLLYAQGTLAKTLCSTLHTSNKEQSIEKAIPIHILLAGDLIASKV